MFPDCRQPQHGLSVGFSTEIVPRPRNSSSTLMPDASAPVRIVMLGSIGTRRCGPHVRAKIVLEISLRYFLAQHFQAMMRVWITTAPKPTDFTNPGGSEAALSAWGL